jgi:hypothetical protein
MGAVSFQNVEPLRYDYIYYHDYHGWRDTKPSVSIAYNAFTASMDHQIESVSFFTAVDDVDYTISIFDDVVMDGQPIYELSRMSGTAEVMGFHTVDLGSPVGFRQGDDFYVQVELSTGGHAFDRTSVVPVLLGTSMMNTLVPSDASPGESLFLDGSEWMDLTSINETGNFCLKACVNPFEPVDGNLTSTGSLQFLNLKPGERREATVLIENIGDDVSSLCWEITEVPDWGRWTITPEEGLFLKPHHGPIEVTVSVIAPFEKNQEFTGSVTITNINNDADFEEIDVTLTTARQLSMYTLIQSLRSWIETLLLSS